MAKTISELKNQSIQVRDASAAGENTATRVGTVLNDIVGHIEDYENTQSSNNTTQDAKIESVKTSLNTEIARAKTEESNLSNQIGTERTERQAAVSKEETARIQADNAEKTARQQADNAEQDARIKADNAEKTARENTDITLRTMIQMEVSDREKAVAAEAARAKAAEEANAQAIAAEAARAKAAEEANATAIEEEKAAIMGTDRIADGAITTEKVADGAVVTEKIVDSAVTYDKLQPEMKDVVENMYYVKNPEFIKYYCDANDRLLWWIYPDGSVDWAKGVPVPIQKELKKLEQIIKDNTEGDESVVARVTANEKSIAAINEALDNYKTETTEALSKKLDGEYEYNPIYIRIERDAVNRLLNAITKDGTNYLPKANVDKLSLNNFIIDNDAVRSVHYVKDPKFIKYTLDECDKILNAITKDGTHFIYKLVCEKFDTKSIGDSLQSTIQEKIDKTLQEDTVLRLPTTIHICNGEIRRIPIHELISNGFPSNYNVLVDDGLYKDFIRVGSYTSYKTTKTFKLINKNNKVVDEKQLTIDVFDVPEKAEQVKILQLGDSKSENRCKLAELINIIEKNGNKINIALIGTLTSNGLDSDGNNRTIKNQAKSGTTICDYVCENTSYNIFYDNDLESGVEITYKLQTKPIKFSIAKAIETLGEIPDILWLDFGANQSWEYYYPDECITKSYDYIIGDVKRYNEANGTNIKVVISDQEGFALMKTVTDKAKSFVWRNYNLYTKRFQNREDEGIFLCPNWLYVDLYNDFPIAEIPIDFVNKQLTKAVCDTTHPGMNMSLYNSSNTYTYGQIVKFNDNGYVCVSENGITGIEPNDDKINWAKIIPESINVGYWHIGQAYYDTLNYIISKI